MTLGVVLVNLGSPLSPDPRDVRRYLLQFLTDGRVVDIPWLSRQLLVRGVIVPKRYKETARSYRAIWTEEGSPLIAYGERLRAHIALEEECICALGMRYQKPSIAEALSRVAHCTKIVILPLFPQYASATSGSIFAEVMRIIAQWHYIPEVRFVSDFAEDEGFINAFVDNIAALSPETYDHLLLSFHGLPVRQLKGKYCMQNGCCAKGDPTCYASRCFATARAISSHFSIDSSVSFQSRLGKEPWLQPSTEGVLMQLLKQGKKRVLVASPSFVCDCLETLYEIGVEYREAFIKAGGEELKLVPGLNDTPQWHAAVQSLIRGQSVKASLCH